MTRFHLLMLAVFCSLPTGCLTHQYELSGDELRRVAELPPHERGQRVRAVQQTDFDSDDTGVEPEFEARSRD